MTTGLRDVYKINAYFWICGNDFVPRKKPFLHKYMPAFRTTPPQCFCTGWTHLPLSIYTEAPNLFIERKSFNGFHNGRSFPVQSLQCAHFAHDKLSECNFRSSKKIVFLTDGSTSTQLRSVDCSLRRFHCNRV